MPKDRIRNYDDPLKLNQVKNHLRVNHDLEDELITSFIESSAYYLEDYIQREVLPSNYLATDFYPDTLSYPYVQVYPEFPCEPDNILATYTPDSTGEPVQFTVNFVWDPTTYLLTIDTPINAIPEDTVDFTVSLDASVKACYLPTMSTARLLLISSWYENRSDLVSSQKLNPNGFESMMHVYKRLECSNTTVNPYYPITS